MVRDRDVGGARNGPPHGSQRIDRESTAERYRKIFEYSNDAVMIVDLSAETFVDVNPAACELLGYSREELLSKRPEEIHPGDRKSVV